MRIVKSCLSAILILTVFSSLSYAVSPDRIPGTIDSTHVVALAKSLHPNARSQYDQGLVAPSLTLSYITLATTPSLAQRTALNQLLSEQQDPSSANYHKWLTPAQYADRFGLSQNDINRITSWLESGGFKVLSVGGGRNTVTFSGTAAQVENAFQTEIHQYNVNGEEHFANSTPIMIPAALQGIVTVVRGLNSFRMHAANHGQLGSGPRMRPDYYDGNYLFPNFLAPGDVAKIYGFSSLSKGGTVIDGTGERIAVIGETDIFLADINDFRSGFTLPVIILSNCTANATSGAIASCDDPHFKYVLIGADPTGAPDSIQQGDISEADLDVEWSGAVAPNAQIIYVNAPDPSGQGVFASLAAAINPPSGPPIAPVITMSYGSCEAQAASAETELQQAAAEGVTVVNSAGDSGAAACDNVPYTNRPFSAAIGGLAVSYPASSAYVVAVGGTAITLADDSYPNLSPLWSTTNGANGSTGGTALQYIPETPWNDVEEWASYCHSPATNDTFCSSGGGTPGWVALPLTATAAEVQADIWISSGGGGASNCYGETVSGVCTSGLPQPTWQQNLAITTLHTSGVRWLPDVSFYASPNFPGYIFCTPLNPDGAPPDYTSTCSGGISTAVDTYSSFIGGTSVGAPVFAGMLALLNQYLVGPSSPGLGDIHPTLYKLAATPSNHAFNQIASGDNMFSCVPGQPSIQTTEPWLICPASGVLGYTSSGTGNFDPTTGYNLVTGLGSVNVADLASAWAASQVNFTLGANPTSATVTAGGSTNITLTVTPGTGFTSTVTFSCPNAPTGVTCAFNPTSVTPSGAAVNSTLTISTLSTLPGEQPTVTVSAAIAGGGSQTVPIALTVIGPTFTLGANPGSATVSAGQSATSTLTITPANGFVQQVTFTCPSAPAGVTCSAAPVTPSSSSAVSTTLTITTLPNMATGAQTVTVSATGGGVTQTTSIALTVNATTETYLLTAQNATYNVTPGQPVSVTISVTSSNGFVTGTAPNQTTVVPVTYTCTGFPSESNCPGITTANATVSFAITTTAPTAQLRRPFDHGSRILYAALLPGLLGIVLTFGSRKRASRLHGMRMLGLIMVLGFSTLWLGSCGGSNNSSQSNPGTPAGTYTMTITATTTPTNVPSTAATFKLVVQ